MSQVLTYATVVGRELGLQDRMTALRNLRPGTRLSWPEGDLSREVLRELLSLPESIDVLRWLEAERGAAVALLAIEQSLDMAGMMYGAQNRIVSGMLTSEQERQVHQSLQDKYGAMYGPLLRSDEDWGAPKQRGDTVDGPPEHCHLVDALTRLRRKIGLPTETSPSRSQVDPGPHTLLADLLRLPDSTDPARWLQDHRLSLSSRLVLEHLLQGAFPMGRSRALCNKRLLTPFDTSEGAHSLKRSSPSKGTADRYPGAWLCCPCKSPIPPSQGMALRETAGDCPAVGGV